MSTDTSENQISFSYNDSTNPSPLVIVVKYDGKIHDVPNDGTLTTFPLQTVPPVQNGLLAIIFRSDYYPLTLFCDGVNMWIPVLANDGGLATLIPFPYETEKNIQIYPISPYKNPGQASISVSAPKADLGIGVVIVGTSGLTDPLN
jgi:hypothetical protein